MGFEGGGGIDYHLLIHEPDLARRHGRRFEQVRPGRVDDRDVFFLVAWCFFR